MIQNIIKKMTPKEKLILTVSTIIFSMIVIILLSFSTLSDQRVLSKSQQLIYKFKADILMLRRNEKDFISRNEIIYINKFKSNSKILQNDIKNLNTILSNLDIENRELLRFKKLVKKYKNLFLKLSMKKVQLGVNTKTGISKNLTLLRKEIDRLELFSLTSMVDQFLITKDLKFVDKFLTIYQTLLPNKTVQEYKDTFISYVDIQKEIGLSYNLGLHKQMRDTVHKTKRSLVKLTTQLDIIFDNKMFDNKTFFITMVTLIGVFIFYIALLIFKDIKVSLTTFKFELEEFFKYLSRENKSVNLLDTSTNGTVGLIAKEVNRYIIETESQLQKDEKVLQEFIEVFLEVGEGNLSKKITSKCNNPSLNTLQDISNEMIDSLNKNIQTTLNTLKKYSNYDYSTQIDTSELKNDFKLLASGVNSLQAAITKLLKENQTNANLLKRHSNILAQHANTIQQSSINQKQNMDKSLKSFSNINKSINESNSYIHNMAIATSELLTSVDAGLSLVDKTNTSMNLIDNQANQIAKTLQIMDDIAVQTNILSLNASVEAVSAGEAGKGFGVVASEVRNLADKSSNAANTIKAIVQKTSNKILDGQEVSQLLTQSFNELSDSIHQTTDFINNLSLSMDRQNSDLKDVNSTIPILEKSISENSIVATKTQEIASDIDDIVSKIVSSTQKQIF